MKLLAGTVPPDKPSDIIAWAEENVRLPGSVRSEKFDDSISPWIIEPLRCVTDPTVKKIDFIKPVQCGGTRVGLIAICWWARYAHGQIQYNWNDDTKAKKKWEDETLPTLEACKGLRWAGGKFDRVSCGAFFVASWVRAQGVFVPEHLDSDSIAYQVNEEVHAWEPGHLAKARGRQTAVWNPKALVISNAGNEGDQLQQSQQEGTDEQWEVRCPGCGQYHAMRTQWEDGRPDLGGLRYDADGARRDDGRYDYNRIESTLRFQMPCGYCVPYDRTARKALSLSGRYGQPRNPGALRSHRSFTLEAVAVDFIDWMQLIQEKHIALRALKGGDSEPWRRYLTERECRFWSIDTKPVGTAIVLSRKPKNAAGLDGRAARLAFFDRQQGSLAGGDSPHWWGLVVDVMPNGDAMPIAEGKMSDAEVEETVKRLDVNPWCVYCDSGDDTSFVYQFCLRNGFNASKGEGRQWYHHKNGTKRLFSDDTSDFLFQRAGSSPFCKIGDNESEEAFIARFQVQEPRFVLYSKDGFYDRLAWMLSERKWTHPADASEAYILQMQSWQQQQRRHPRTNERIVEWVQTRTHDHLWACAAGIVMQIEMAGLIAGIEQTEA